MNPPSLPFSPSRLSCSSELSKTPCLSVFSFLLDTDLGAPLLVVISSAGGTLFSLATDNAKYDVNLPSFTGVKSFILQILLCPFLLVSTT